jgi:hypothetical protein
LTGVESELDEEIKTHVMSGKGGDYIQRERGIEEANVKGESGCRRRHTSSSGSRSRGMVLAVGDLLDRHVLNSIGVRLQLVDIEHENITLDLIGLSVQIHRP